MVIRKLEDTFELLKERIEAMEDLDCEDLYDCVFAFMQLSTQVASMEAVRDLRGLECSEGESKAVFEAGKTAAVMSAQIIDKLTLKDDAAE